MSGQCTGNVSVYAGQARTSAALRKFSLTACRDSVREAGPQKIARDAAAAVQTEEVKGRSDVAVIEA